MIQINIYRSAGTWYAALFVGGEYDSCDELPCDADASEDEARESALRMPLVVTGERTVTRVADVSGDTAALTDLCQAVVSDGEAHGDVYPQTAADSEACELGVRRGWLVPTASGDYALTPEGIEAVEESRH